MPFRILIADDEIDSPRDEISRLPEMLRAAGYEVRTVADPGRAYDLVWEFNPDLIVLDVKFIGHTIDGIHICEAIRQNGCEIPIILITAIMTETETVLRGFRAGADDYVTRPRDPREILARIRANLPPEVTVFDECILIDGSRCRVWVCRQGKWQETHLQPLQYALLDVLTVNAGQTVLTTTLKERVWGKTVSDSALAVYIHRLRDKLEPEPAHPIYIETIKEFGYRFNSRPRRASLALLEFGCGCARGELPDE